MKPPSRTGRWGAVRPGLMAAAGTLTLLAPWVQASAAEPEARVPPQVLPISARWCLDRQRCIQLEVPRTDRQYSMGLQLRPPLPPLCGMWFPFEPPSLARFWMHRTPEPLDMLFVRDGRVTLIEAKVPPCMHLPCRSYGPDGPVEGVMELGAGESARLGIRVGTPVRVEALVPAGR